MIANSVHVAYNKTCTVQINLYFCQVLLNTSFVDFLVLSNKSCTIFDYFDWCIWVLCSRLLPTSFKEVIICYIKLIVCKYRGQQVWADMSNNAIFLWLNKLVFWCEKSFSKYKCWYFFMWFCVFCKQSCMEHVTDVISMH